MGKKLQPQELKLYKAIDKILWRDWDPVGVSRIEDWPPGEYQTYVPQVYQLALTGDRVKIADYLFTIAVERMGLTTKPSQHLVVADKILIAKAQAGL